MTRAVIPWRDHLGLSTGVLLLLVLECVTWVGFEWVLWRRVVIFGAWNEKSTGEETWGLRRLESVGVGD